MLGSTHEVTNFTNNRLNLHFFPRAGSDFPDSGPLLAPKQPPGDRKRAPGDPLGHSLRTPWAPEGRRFPLDSPLAPPEASKHSNSAADSLLPLERAPQNERPKSVPWGRGLGARAGAKLQ